MLLRFADISLMNCREFSATKSHMKTPLCIPGARYLRVIWILWRLSRESAVAFQLNFCFSASISLVVVVLLFITVLCLFGDIPPLVSLLPDARLLTFQLFGCCAVRVTLYWELPIPKVVKRVSNPEQVSLVSLVVSTSFALFLYSYLFIFIYLFTFLPTSLIDPILPFVSPFHFSSSHLSFSFALSLPFCLTSSRFLSINYFYYFIIIY